jgi:hypothetical protein
MRELCQRVEKRARAGKSRLIWSLLDRLEREFERAERLVRQWALTSAVEAPKKAA